MGGKLLLAIDANENPLFMNFFHVMLKEMFGQFEWTDFARSGFGRMREQHYSFPPTSGVINSRGCITFVFSLLMQVPVRLSLQRRCARITNVHTSHVYVLNMLAVVMCAFVLYIARRTLEWQVPRLLHLAIHLCLTFFRYFASFSADPVLTIRMERLAFSFSILC